MMYPVLLDDQSLANQFQMFIETIDESYEVSLSTNQQYPVSYLFLFVNAHNTTCNVLLGHLTTWCSRDRLRTIVQNN